mgnify:CR=1 FL=1
MRDPVREAKEQFRDVINGALDAAVEEGLLPGAERPDYNIEIPADAKNGDLATNAAMVCARALHLPPRKIAEAVAAKAQLSGTCFERMEIAGPGFINVFYAKDWYAGTVAAVLSEGEKYGESDWGGGRKIMIEFVSANPTGPMHMGNARGGAIGDGLAAAFEKCGWNVTREFYINDAGNQIEKFGVSLEARYLQIYKGEDAVEFPEEGYHGEDIKVRAREFADLHGDSYVDAEPEKRRRALIDYALPKNIEGLQRDLGKYRINYDVWFRESSLYKDGTVDKVVGILRDKGLTYEKDGALWYRNAEVVGAALAAEGKTPEQIEALELKDDVLIRANGNPTYFAGDIAYHYNKFAIRGFDRVINVWGADHHGHVARLKGAMDAVGCGGDRLDIVLMQLVELMRNGKPERMSKRTGRAITLTDLLEEVPIDAARFFFNMREPNTHLVFDLGLAVEQSAQNPVYYVQYAHARICSILRNLAAEGIEPKKLAPEGLRLYDTDEEKALIALLAKYPGEITETAKSYDTARLTRYATDMATAFHRFYTACRCKGEEEHLMQARLSLCLAAKTVIANVLTLLKVDVPESM